MEIYTKKQSTIPFLILMLLSFQSHSGAQGDPSYKEMHVGLIHDMGSAVGKIVYRCITMAISDFYAVNPWYTTRIVLQTRNTNGEPLRALSAGLDLLDNKNVQAIIGPESAVEAKFLEEVLAEKAGIPILSFSETSSSNNSPYFIRITQDETTQFKGIAAMAESFKWKSLILICEDTANGREMATYIDAFQEKSLHITYISLISNSASNDQVLEELHKVANMQTTIFTMHTSPSVASHVLSNAKKLGMMGEGYIWIMTTKTTNFLDHMNPEVIGSMQGIVGFKSYIPVSRKLHNFRLKWKKEYYATNAITELKDLNAYGIWAYDAAWALAMAVERVQAEEQVRELASKDMASTSQRGEALTNQMLRIKYHGLGGEFKLMNGRIITKGLEIINLIGKGESRAGFWTIANELTKDIRKINSSANNSLETIIWPGGTTNIPKRKMKQTSGKKLRVAVPVPDAIGFKNLVHLTVDPRTGSRTVSGFCGDVFQAAFNALNYGDGIDFVPFTLHVGDNYNNMIDKVYLQEFDAAVGDITITANRSLYVDFTLPFSDLGVGMLARNADQSMWIFLEPLSADLWITSACFFLLLGFVIWFIEHRINEEFQGSAGQQFGTTIWFAFSTLVYAHREKLKSNLSRFVVTIWVFVVLVLTSSYTATLSSLLTVRQIASKEVSVGFQALSLSPVGGVVFENLQYADQRFEPLYTPEDYLKALSSGGLSAIVDEILYVKTVLAQYPANGISLIGTAATTNGFGFVFQKGSPLAMKMSTEIAKLREDGTLKALEDKWLNRQSTLIPSDFAPTPKILNLDGFRGLFLISGVSMALALLLSMLYVVREKLFVKNKIHLMRYLLSKSAKIYVEDNNVELPQ